MLFLLMITIKRLTPRSSRKIFLCHEIGERLEKIMFQKGRGIISNDKFFKVNAPGKERPESRGNLFEVE